MTAQDSVFRKLYRAVVPASVRGSLFAEKLKSRILGHDELYHATYYAEIVEGPAVESATVIVGSIMRDFKPKRVVDVGCGTGALLEKLRENGTEVFGLEYAEAGLAYCRARKLDVAKFDLEKDVLDDKRTFDVAVSMEVAEHLPASVADRYIDLLTRLAPAVVFTAAPVGQGGHDHVNEQPPSYWIAKFKQRGFTHDVERTERWKQEWQAAPKVVSWYYKNLMLFKRA